MSIFYNNYISLCAKHNKSASKVAEEIGLSRASANGWRNGAVPSEVNLQKIANYFGVTVDYLKTEAPLKFIHGGEEIQNGINNVLDKVLNGDQATKKPLSKDEERLKEIYNETADLSDAEIVALKAFVAGLKANRKPD